MSEFELPNRYEPVARLGKGGGGEVWAVRDQHTGANFALKVLAVGASEREMAALVREAVSLSGLEGLGVPRVVRFGRLPGSGRAFLVRELVEGRGLDEMLHDSNLESVLEALARAADQLTLLHRAGLLHGDVKPANIIVEPSGKATFVDLGLAAPWREGGATAEGLTPRYAAPELFAGKPLTVRAEVYALGAALAEAVQEATASRLDLTAQNELRAIAARAMANEPSERYPSVDEFATALRRASGLSTGSDFSPDAFIVWPIVGIDAISSQLLDTVRGLRAGDGLRLIGPPGSGRSALLRRLAWSLGVQGQAIAWIDGQSMSASGVSAELAAHRSLDGVRVLVDDADALEPVSLKELENASKKGAVLIVVGEARLAAVAHNFQIPALDERAALELVRRAVPSLTESLQKRLVELSHGRPGELRKLARLVASQVVVSPADIERAFGSLDAQTLPDAPLDRAKFFLDHGRFNDAKAVLETVPESERKSPMFAIANGRLELGIGEPSGALAWLRNVLVAGTASAEEQRMGELYLARAHIAVGECQRALELLEAAPDEDTAFSAEALAYRGLALSLTGRHEEAVCQVTRSTERAKASGSPRAEAITLASLAVVLQRSDKIDEAREAYRTAINAAERAGDAGTLATLQLNLAGLLKIRGDIAAAIENFEAAVDMSRRSGRRAMARQALLNLANTDLYLGRLARARASIEALEEQRAQLPAVMRAQLSGLQAELALRQGQLEQAVRLFDACASAYEALGRGIDSAEARLEGVLADTRATHPNLQEVRRRILRAEEELGDSGAHKPLLLLATGRVAQLAGDEIEARAKLDAAIAAAREAAQKEWIWRALEARAELEDAGGQPLLARRDREEALAVLEEIGARLPRDLREVYWNDPRRRNLRGSVPVQVGTAATEFLPFSSGVPTGLAPGGTRLSNRTSRTSTISSVGTPLEQRLARILEVNSQLVGEHDLNRLTAKITDYAVELSRAERGFVLLQDETGLIVYTSRSRAGDEIHHEFSRSIAEQVIATREPVVTLNARDDSRMASYASVHQMMLQSVACVPILAPGGAATGALYLETRVRPGLQFERELPTLRAFADQVAIALENARLINENKKRADELAVANAELEKSHQHVRELLEGRTEQLKRARQKLRDARDTLYGHFGYQGLVGTSQAMRRVYALIDRVKDADIPVLITGESGTGKEVVARAIHTASARGKGKMLGVNCGAIPENLLESELFGHLKGAFTGADRDRKGLFRECQGGSILLDEIGETPLKMQAGLLRVLQERKVRPVGGTNEESVDVRVLFATNRDLSQMVSEGRFREDLYYRIHVVEIRLPALRERSEDIPQLVDYFLGLFAARYKREKGSVSKEALRRLADYDWPGNVRQLEHVLLNAWILSEDAELLAEDFDLPDDFRQAPAKASFAASTPSRSDLRKPRPAKKGTVSEHRRDERERILEALKACNWNRVKAAELSGIPRRTFYRRLREYGIQ